MELADEMVFAIKAGNFDCERQAAALRTKLEAMEADRVRLLEALCALVLNIDAGGATLAAMADARAAIAQSKP